MNTTESIRGRVPLIERFREYLPLTDRTPVVSLGEGFTPLVAAKKLAKALGIPTVDVRLKLEGLNPTGSFKDRGMTMAISKAVEEGSKAVICASTGNTSASAAAFAAKAGLACYVLLPAGKVALGKLAQAILYGSKVIQIDGNFDQALDLVRLIGEKFPVTIVNSINPYRLEGQKTGAFEVMDTLGEAPDYLCIPVGNAGNISAYFRGFTQYHRAPTTGQQMRYKGSATAEIEIVKGTLKVPQMCGFQAAGAAPMVLGKPVPNPETLATAIRIGNPASWQEAQNAIDKSGGLVDMVTDEEILEAYKMLAQLEGVFCEPASAASVAGLKKLAAKGGIPHDATVVCVLTGNGLKDPDNALKVSDVKLEPIKPDLDVLVSAMGL
ncbi:threonine synthase [Candidatus Obscuribacterales bacterium]|nr:threonine synthase [Candidatus Obscuribacterales bacterium]MBX3148890.1 threonine synthase [Candidatus Obscuribacterales bacterium]